MRSHRETAFDLGLHGLLLHFDGVSEAEWLPWLLKVESAERARRSLESRLKSAKLEAFKPLTDFDWTWLSKLDRRHVAALFILRFIEEKCPIILTGPNGVGKTLLTKNIADARLLGGHSVLFTTASVMRNALAAGDSASAVERRLRRLCRRKVLCITT
jgi:DNA replication protein DnaC